MEQEIKPTQLSFFEDRSSSLTISDVSASAFQHNFLPVKMFNGFNKGNCCYWLKFDIMNPNRDQNAWLFNFDKWQYVDLFEKAGERTFIKKISGHLLPFDQRDTPIANYSLIKTSLLPGQVVTCYVRLRGITNDVVSPADLSFSIFPEKVFLQRENFRLNLVYFFLGIYLVMFFYNMFIYISVRERGYVYYLGVLFFLFLAVIENTGYSVQLLRGITFFPLWYGKFDVLLSSLFGSLILLFARDFLKLNEKRWSNTTIHIFFCLLGLTIIPAFTGHLLFAVNMSSVIGLFTMIFIMAASVSRCVEKYPSAVLFLIAYGAFVIGVILYLLAELGWLANNQFNEFSMQSGSALAAILFSLALANRINNLKKENETYHQEIIRQLDNNNKLQSKLNLELEAQVEQRTRELKESQRLLVQKEKQVAMVELTAGIAHELLNPLNFVNNFSEVTAEIVVELKEEIELDKPKEVSALIDEIEQNLQKINFHGKRADSIVKNMLQHSAISSGQVELTDMNMSVNEFVKLSYQNFRKKDSAFIAEIVTDLANDLPCVRIIPQDIGKVLFNLFNNAFYALAEKKQQEQGFVPVLNISTVAINEMVEIKITDNGTGVPAHLTGKIFQPFFTTKPAGEGTGLGLSLSFDIVKTHGGEISVESVEGRFTSLILKLPV